MAGTGSRTLAPIGVAGNGTGPGTPFPQRRGPKRGARRPKGIPEHLRSIEVKLGGRWFGVYLNGVEYLGGETRYIHNVNPSSFSVEELFMSSQMMLVGRFLPTRMWYHCYGAEIPEGLYAIEDDLSLHEMWKNCEIHGMWMARIYMQDVEFVVNPDPLAHGRLTYLIPHEIPPVFGFQDALILHKDAEALHQVISELGEEVVGAQEVYGDRWYIHTKFKPFAPLDRNLAVGPPYPTKFMMELPIRNSHTYEIMARGGPEVYIDVYDQMIAQQLRIPD